MKVVVTGGAGFVGSNLIKRLVEEDHTVISIDNYSVGKVSNHVTGAHYIKGDVVDIEEILKSTHDIDAVFHLGNYSRIATSFDQIDPVWESNFIGTFRVVEFCRKRDIKLIYAGSSTKFSREGMAHSPYSFTKGVSTEIIENYGIWYNLKYAICYFYNVFGPGYDSSPVPGYESVVSVFEKQWKDGKPLTICGTGEQTRTFTYVEDVVNGLILSWKYPVNEEFQLDSKEEFAIKEIAEMFSENIVYVPERRGDRKSSPTSSQKAYDLLKWGPTISVVDWINQIKKEHENN